MITLLILFFKIIWYYWELESFDFYVYKTKTKTYQQAIEDEREITDFLLEGRTVVLNVEGLAVDIAQRIIDFVSGSCYAMDGNLQKISNYIFIITPASVDISGDFQAYVDTFDVNSFKSEF